LWHFNRQGQTADHPSVPNNPTFANAVAPIVFAKCANCHHPGEAAPFNLLSYDDVKRRARQIVDVTQKKYMPPWLPKEGHGDFIGSRRLTSQELQTIKQWVDSGAPSGEQSEMPTVPVFTDGWQIGPPDLVLETQAYTLSSQERDVFRNFVVPIALKEPRWVQSIELRPVNPRVTHHARLGVDSTNESIRRDAEDPEPGYAGMAWGQDPDGQLVIWAPGMVANPGLKGVAWRLYPNATIVLHTHMQPSGKPEVVRFRVGIRFAKDSPTRYPAMLRIGCCDIDIPAGARAHTVKDQFTLPIDVDIHTVFPHAHSLCQQITVTAERPDGSSVPLISIDKFDESWHDMYRYRQPVRLLRGTRVVSTFTYDNTDDNVRNRNHPARRVVYGSNASDEMADVYLQVTAVNADQRAVLMEVHKRYEFQAQVTGFTRSLELYPDNPWSQEALAGNLVALGQPAKAISILEQRLKTGPMAVFPVVSLGMALLANGDLANAEAKLRQAIEMDKDYTLAWFGLGKALTAQKKLELAEQAYRRAVELAPGTTEARLNLADILMKDGRWESAKEVCVAAITDSPDAANVHLKLAEICAKMKNYDECLNHCNAAKRLAPYTHPPKVLVGVFCFANGDAQRAQKLLLEAKLEEPNHPVPVLFLGQLARMQKQGQLARDFLAKAGSIPMPDNWPPSHRHRFAVLLQTELLQLAQQLQDVEMARDALSQWLKYEPNNQQLRKMLEGLPAKAGS